MTLIKEKKDTHNISEYFNLLKTNDNEKIEKLINERNRSAKRKIIILSACESVMVSAGIGSILIGHIGIGAVCFISAFVLANCEIATL